MKVLQINTVCGTGSTGRIATDLYEILEEQGHECVIAYGRGSAPEGINSIKIGSKIDMYIHGIKTRIFDKHGFSSTRATKEFIEKVKEYDPDVIHLHNIHGYYINIEILFNYLRESKKKVVWTLHDCWAFTGHCSYFDYVRCEKWKIGCNKCEQKKEYPASNLKDNSKWSYEKKKELFNSIDKDKLTIITPSEWLARIVTQSYLKKYKVEVIHNGIDLDLFRPIESNFRKKYNIAKKKIILGVANCWDRRKGLNYFVDLSKKLSKDYQIVVVGVSKKQKKELPKNIIAITKTNNIKELVKIYSATDVFFNPTLEDNFPTTNLESLACGIPVLTFNTGGSVECIDEETGVINLDFEKSIHLDIESCLKLKKNVALKKYDKRECYLKYLESMVK